MDTALCVSGCFRNALFPPPSGAEVIDSYLVTLFLATSSRIICDFRDTTDGSESLLAIAKNVRLGQLSLGPISSNVSPFFFLLFGVVSYA